MLISELTLPNDQLYKKTREVNAVLSRECNKRNICVTKHDNMNARRHCNMSGLHLNWDGTNILIENVLFYLNRFCSIWLVTKVSENSKKSAQFELISRQNNSNIDLTKEFDKGDSCLRKLRAKHPKNILFGHLNMNSLRNKFEYLEEIIKKTFHVVLV